MKTGAWFLAGLAPGVALLAALQWAMYGSPFGSGYGPTRDLFHHRNIVPNLEHYGRSLWETHTPILALAIAGPMFVRHRTGAWLALALAAGIVAAYLPYRVFEEWWYLRFLLPALPFLIVLTLAVLVWLAGRVFPSTGGLQLGVTALIVVILGTWWVSTARERQAFNLQRLERHFIEAGRFAARDLPPNAAVLTVKHSGSVQYYAERPTVLWDTLPADSLDSALEFLRAQGLAPILMLDELEEPEFRERFGGASKIGQLDWPPVARVARTVRVYDPADRARYWK